jgi:hypothetical protein
VVGVSPKTTDKTEIKPILKSIETKEVINLLSATKPRMPLTYRLPIKVIVEVKGTTIYSEEVEGIVQVLAKEFPPKGTLEIE